MFPQAGSPAKAMYDTCSPPEGQNCPSYPRPCTAATVEKNYTVDVSYVGTYYFFSGVGDDCSVGRLKAVVVVTDTCDRSKML